MVLHFFLQTILQLNKMDDFIHTNFWKNELRVLVSSYEKHGGNLRPIHEEAWYDALKRAQNLLVEHDSMVHTISQDELEQLVDQLNKASDGASAMGFEQDSWTFARASFVLKTFMNFMNFIEQVK